MIGNFLLTIGGVIIMNNILIIQIDLMITRIFEIEPNVDSKLANLKTTLFGCECSLRWILSVRA